MKYRVIYNFSDGHSEDMLEELFDSEEEAEQEARQGAADYDAGGDVFDLMDDGDHVRGAEIESWDIEEVDE